MKNSVLLKAVCLTVLLALVAWAPQSALAQRGGHGGGGGYHGGGGGGFHGGGGGYYGGHNGGGYYGAHHGGGGYYGAGYYRSGYHGGWRGGYYGGGDWGYPGYGWGFGWGSGWGFGISIGWGGYWPNYSYDYGYGPAWPVPYYPAPSPSYYYAAPSGYAAPAGYTAAPGYAAAAPDYLGARSRDADARAVSPSANPTPANVSGGSSATIINASYRTNPTIRPEVRTVIRALQGMPPGARQGQLSRYTDLSPSERDLVIRVADVPES
jgi:hypothetical protein